MLIEIADTQSNVGINDGINDGINLKDKEVYHMMYPFMTLDDGTEIVHSEMKSDGSVKVYIEKPDGKTCFHHATCYLPEYKIEDVFGFTKEEMNKYLEVIKSTAHLIMEFSQQGGLENEEVIKDKVLEIVDYYPITKISLFGSRASGTNTEDSDVDLIMEFSEPVSLLILSQIKCQLEEMLGLEVDVIHGPLRETDMIEIDKVVELYTV